MNNSKILSIGALDSSGGAGLNQDIRISALLKREISVCQTGITLQSVRGVEFIHPTSLLFLEKQLLYTLRKNPPRWIKIGALCDIKQVHLLCGLLPKNPSYKIVLDSVLSPTLGLPLINTCDIAAYRELLQITNFVAPNYPELSSLAQMPIQDFESAIDAAKSLAQKHSLGVLLKGGHDSEDTIREAFVAPDELHIFEKARKKWSYSHGTGCALSMAFTCFLADSLSPRDAFEKASNLISDIYDKWNGIDSQDHPQKLDQ
ncbi:MAG: hydroxymethylpyrimidine/phosphomethylpyrimidine kinase [Candidatus Cloacimonadaceae bacterium]|nr:hydroxymethylpyrimidine/phosphomethylpyrimidine kinase [Candidatus Cloacimonadaceae bacterium]